MPKSVTDDSRPGANGRRNSESILDLIGKFHKLNEDRAKRNKFVSDIQYSITTPFADIRATHNALSDTEVHLGKAAHAASPQVQTTLHATEKQLSTKGHASARGNPPGEKEKTPDAVNDSPVHVGLPNGDTFAQRAKRRMSLPCGYTQPQSNNNIHTTTSAPRSEISRHDNTSNDLFKTSKPELKKQQRRHSVSHAVYEYELAKEHEKRKRSLLLQKGKGLLKEGDEEDRWLVGQDLHAYFNMWEGQDTKAQKKKSISPTTHVQTPLPPRPETNMDHATGDMDKPHRKSSF